MTGIHRRGALLAAPALIGVLSGRAHAQAWPARQVRIVVGFAAGGANDIMARLLAAKLGERIPGSTFEVENRPAQAPCWRRNMSRGNRRMAIPIFSRLLPR